MSRELPRFYRSLAQAADGQVLPDPDALRRRADRRARTRTVTVLAAAILVAATVAGTRAVLAPESGTPAVPPGGHRSTGPTPSPSVATSPPTGPTGRPAGPANTPGTAKPTTPRGGAPGTPTSIPDRAFFTQPPGTAAVPPTFVPGNPVPELCAARYPSDASLAQRRTRNLVYRNPDTPKGHVPDGSYRHSITIYRDGRATTWMDELRRAVRNCPEQERVKGIVSRQRLLGSGDFGDESMLFEMREPAVDVNGDPTGDTLVRLVRAIRIGDVVTVLWEQGWEGTSSERRQIDDYSRRAVTAIRNWLD